MTDSPVVVIAVGVDDDALDTCLAALDRSTPAGTPVWLADDAQAGPRGRALIERWRTRTRLQADYTRRQRSVGEVAHLDEVLTACGDADVAVLAADAVVTPGWLAHLQRTLDDDRAIATVTPWCNAGEAAAWPTAGRIAPIPDDLERLARAAAGMPRSAPELPAAVGHAVLLRGAARRRAGGLDATGFASWYAALTDLSLRLSGLGWRNVLCERSFVARRGEGGPRDGDMDALAARWPGWHARIAGFLMRDPLLANREALTRHLADAAETTPQADLFAGAAPVSGDDVGAAPGPCRDAPRAGRSDLEAPPRVAALDHATTAPMPRSPANATVREVAGRQAWEPPAPDEATDALEFDARA